MLSKQATKVQLQTPSVFFSDFIKSTFKARSRVWVQVMLFESGKKAIILEKKLISLKKKKHIDIKLALDWVSNVAIHGKINLTPRLKGKKYADNVHKKTLEILARLENKGIEVFINNKPNLAHRIIPLLKRNHIKIYVIDNKFAWIGGMNFTDNSFNCVDFMVKFSDQKIVEKISKQFNFQKKKGNLRITLNQHYILYIDNGYHGRSIILNKELKMIDTSKKKILFVSQGVPDGIVLKKLISKAKEGVKIIVLTSNVENDMFQKMPYKLLYKYFKFQTRGLPNIKLIHIDKKIHAKYLEIDGKQILFGSHNLLHSTVLLGTKELSVYSDDRNLIEQVNSFLNNEVRKI